MTPDLEGPSTWWSAVVAVQPTPPSLTLAVVVAVVLAGVVWTPSWRVLRHAVTLVHEASHAGVAALGGRRLQGVRLHRDTSGLTTTVGRARGPAAALTVLAGYPGPAVVGLVAAATLATGRALLVLWVGLAVVLVLAVWVRNAFGLVSVAMSAGLLVVVTGWAPADVQTAAAYALTLLLLWGAARAVLELAAGRRRPHHGPDDADALSRTVGLPAGLWLLVLVVATAVPAALGTALVVLP